VKNAKRKKPKATTKSGAKKKKATKKKAPKKKAPKKSPAPKSEDGASSSLSDLEAVVKTLQKNKGKGALTIVGSKSSYAMAPKHTISTGCFAVDYAIAGGIPEEKMVIIYGDPNVGKTSKAYSIMGNSQQKCRNCRQRIRTKINFKGLRNADGEEIPVDKVIVNWQPSRYVFEAVYHDATDKILAEAKMTLDLTTTKSCGCKTAPEPYLIAIACMDRKFDHGWARNFGVSGEGLVIVQGETGEDTIDIIDSLIREGVVDLVVIDSLAQMVPKKEIKKDADDEQPALQAKMLNRAMRKWSNALVGYGADDFAPTIIMINQTRLNVGMFGGQFRPGGRGQLFASTVDIKLSRGKFSSGAWAKKHVALDKNKRAVAQCVKFAITKCMVGPPNTEGYYQLNLRPFKGRTPGTVDDEHAVANFATITSMFKPGEDLFGRSFPSEPKLVQEFFSDREYFYTVREELMKFLLTESTDWMEFGVWKPVQKPKKEEEADVIHDEDWIATEVEFD